MTSDYDFKGVTLKVICTVSSKKNGRTAHIEDDRNMDADQKLLEIFLCLEFKKYFRVNNTYTNRITFHIPT